MKSLLNDLSTQFGDAFEASGLDRGHGQVQLSNRPDLCQFQCNGALAAAKSAGKAPRALAEAALAALKGKERFKELSLAGPGFINISLTDEALKDAVQSQAAAGLGVGPGEGIPVFVDYGGPNVAKPMHVGHLRSTILGDSLCRLHRRLGNKVLSDVHLGDWGTQMGMLIVGVQEEQPGLPYFEAANKGPFPSQSPVSLEDLERLYPKMSSRCKEDKSLAEKSRLATRDLQSGHAGYRALWRHFVDVSSKALKEDFSDLGANFDLWLGESDSQADIPPMLEDLKSRGLLAESEGAQVIHLPAEKNTEVPPLLLVKGDGGYLYGTTDLACLRDRVTKHGSRRILYVADKRQSLHFRQVFAGARLAGYLGEATPEHVEFGTVNGKDGKPFKTRDGGAMRLRALLDMAVSEAAKRMDENEIAKELSREERGLVAKKVGYAAIKVADLMNHRSQDYVFDLEKFTQFVGRTGPYLLYAAVRMRAIARKAAERGLKAGELLPPSDFERDLFLKVTAWPLVLERAAQDSLPHVLCEYAFDLSGLFSAFYQNCNIINEPDAAKRGSWLTLSGLISRVLEDALGVLGLEIPEKM